MSRKILWGMDINRTCKYLADRGLHARTIAEVTGLTATQVYYRCQRLGIHLRDYRDGKGQCGSVLVTRFAITGNGKCKSRGLLDSGEAVCKQVEVQHGSKSKAKAVAV